MKVTHHSLRRCRAGGAGDDQEVLRGHREGSWSVMAGVARGEHEGAAGEEKRNAIERGSFHEGVSAIAVIVDGGWSKRSHKHS